MCKCTPQYPNQACSCLKPNEQPLGCGAKRFEVGQVWLRRSGNKSTIIYLNGGSPFFPVIAVDESGSPFGYTLEGKFYIEAHTGMDLVSLYTPPKTRKVTVYWWKGNKNKPDSYAWIVTDTNYGKQNGYDKYDLMAKREIELTEGEGTK